MLRQNHSYANPIDINLSETKLAIDRFRIKKLISALNKPYAMLCFAVQYIKLDQTLFEEPKCNKEAFDIVLTNNRLISYIYKSPLICRLNFFETEGIIITMVWLSCFLASLLYFTEFLSDEFLKKLWIRYSCISRRDSYYVKLILLKEADYS